MLLRAKEHAKVKESKARKAPERRGSRDQTRGELIHLLCLSTNRHKNTAKHELMPLPTTTPPPLQSCHATESEKAAHAWYELLGVHALALSVPAHQNVDYRE